MNVEWLTPRAPKYLPLLVGRKRVIRTHPDRPLVVWRGADGVNTTVRWASPAPRRLHAQFLLEAALWALREIDAYRAANGHAPTDIVIEHDGTRVTAVHGNG